MLSLSCSPSFFLRCWPICSSSMSSKLSTLLVRGGLRGGDVRSISERFTVTPVPSVIIEVITSIDYSDVISGCGFMQLLSTEKYCYM